MFNCPQMTIDYFEEIPQFNNKNDLEKAFIKFLQKKYENTDFNIKNVNIIDERNEFEKKFY